MPQYQVIAEFVDLQAKVRRRPGDVVEVTPERARRLQAIGVIASEPVTTRQPAENDQGDQGSATSSGTDAGTGDDQDLGYVDLGRGWYQLPNGEKVHGKQALEEALARLKSTQGGDA